MKQTVKDIVGGVTASFVLLPRNMAFGLLIFLPFGSEYASLGIAAGVMSLLIANVVSAYIGSVPIMCVSTFSLSALILMSMNEYLMRELTHMGVLDPAPVAILLCFIGVLFAGFFQMSFGVLKMGNLAKYIPYPVLSGLLNGTGLAIVMTQLRVITDGTGYEAFELQHYLLVSVAAVTILAAVIGPRLLKQIPSVFFGLIFGSIFYYLAQRQYFPEGLGQLVGRLPDQLPTPAYAGDMVSLLSSGEMVSLVGTVVLFGAAVGAADTMRAALSCLIVDLKTKVRSDFNRELVGEGLGNMISAFFGSITSTGNATGALNNFSHGGRREFSRLTCGLTVLMILLFLGSVVELIPMVVLAAVMIVLTVAIMDFTFVDDAKQLFSSALENRSQIAWNLVLEGIVALLVVAVDLFIALAFGLGISVGLFVLNMSKQIVRDSYTGDELPSNVLRQEAEQAFLDDRAHSIRMLELEGALFFGTADRLHDHLDPILENGVEAIIVDLKLVTQIDQTAVEILTQCSEKAKDAGKVFALGSMSKARAESRFPVLQVAVEAGDLLTFDTADDAMAWAEQHVLTLELGRNFHLKDLELEDINVLSELDGDQLGTLKYYLHRREFQESDYLIREGKSEQTMYLIARGEAVVGRRYNGSFQRYSTIRVGSVVGEMSLFDSAPRSADVFAGEDVVCYELTGQKLDLLKADHPEVAYNLLVGLNRMYADRLRNANQVLARLR